jgi:hypothetical protein
MGIQRRGLRRSRIAVAGAVAALASAGSAFAFQGLPPGQQVNNDPGAGINPALSVNGEEPTNADVVGGALTAGKVAVPWSIFRQTESGGVHDQVFSRSFAGGAWTTRGSGTFGGRSSASPTFSGSLNFDQRQDGEAPAIDFAGAGRTVPWATWYENTPNIGAGTGFGSNNIFASRFDNTGDANQGKWIFGGQGRGTGSDQPADPAVPSLNIRTAQDAENPSVAGGSAADATKPGPWVAWQETTTLPVNDADQIFVSRPEGPGLANCDGVTPAGVADGSGHVPAVGGFCFQQTGVGRVGPGSADPSLNVDPTRNGVEPDIAFTGKNAAGVQDGVPWVVWYEKDNTNNGISGLTHNNEMVFAAKGLADPTAGRGGFSWTAVGSLNSALLDASGTNHFGGCAVSDTAEAGCSLNKNPAVDAEDPRVAAGTMNPANATVPWVAWDEDLNGTKQVFVSRLVGGTHFELANNGQPISLGANDSTRPDITFSGNTPYVSWREDIGGGIEKAFVGHFVNAANPTFVLDDSDVALTPHGQADVREPISSGCTANPFNQDGAVCQGSAVGTPLFLFTSGTSPSPLSLFADAYQPATPVTGSASGIGTSTATIAGAVNPQGARVNASFQFGTTTAYGQSTAAQTLGADNAADPFAAALTGLPAGTIIHYRAVATSDFGTVVGADQTLKTGTTPPPPPPAQGKASVGHARVSGTTASVKITCKGATSCKVSLKLTVTETFRGHKLTAVSARKQKLTHKTVVVGTASATIRAGHNSTVKIKLNGTGRKLLAARHKLTAKLTVTQKINGRNRTLSTQKPTFKAPSKPKPKHGGG